MKRLTIPDRGRISRELRRHVLQKQDRRRLAMIEDPAVAPSEHVADALAFEWWMDIARKRLIIITAEQVVYTGAWVSASFQKDEVIRTPDKIARVAMAMFNKHEEERGTYTTIALEWFENEVGWDSPVDRDECVAFIHEIVQELLAEFVRAYAAKH